MTFITRVTRLLKADLHGILDCLEEPQELLKQSMREMEEILAQEKEELQALKKAQEHLSREKKFLVEASEEINRQIDICFGAENSELAKSFIRKKIEKEKQNVWIERKYCALEARIVKQSSTIEQHLERLKAIQEKARVFAREAHEQSWKSCNTSYAEKSSLEVAEEEVEVRFLEEVKKRESQEQRV